ncbi:MAG: baseplate J/gp47 family protein [Rhizobiaceae bacterium]|nr:baseplate J/gp47 family protein [Rhizobiaceae bacterium]
MEFASPRLDDADAAALMGEARAALARSGGGWLAEDPADPGVALLEAFAHITAQELKRLNTLPKAAQASFLTMLGARLRPGTAAAADLQFTLAAPRSIDTPIAAGTRVGVARNPRIVFSTLAPAIIPAGASSVTVAAAEVQIIPEAIVAYGTGSPGQIVQLRHRPLPGAPGLAARVDVKVAVGPEGPPPGAPVEAVGSAVFIRFREVARVEPDDTDAVFAVDRVAGTISLPLKGPFIPAPGAAIRAGYAWMESMTTAAVPEDALTEPLTALPGIKVSNALPAVSGRPAETTEEALLRGADAIFAGGAALRARDYEALATEAHPAVARAHAAARSERWLFSRPGAVEVRIAPSVEPDTEGAITLEAAGRAAADPGPGAAIMEAVRAALDRTRPLGVSVDTSWIRMKAVGVSARIYVAKGADGKAIASAVRRRLNGLLRPVPGGVWPQGWPLGRALRQSEVIETIASTPGVRALDRVVLRPSHPMGLNTSALAADCAQSGVWFAVVDGRLYRTLDDGEGWNMAIDDAVVAVATHPLRSGLLAVAAADNTVHVSRDCGETFAPFAVAHLAPEAMLWSDGGETPRLLLAGEANLAEAADPGDAPAAAVRDLVGADGLVGRAYALAAHPDGRGGRLVAVARRELGGILLSNDNGWDGGFEPIGLAGKDVRALAFLQTEDALWLVAGCARPAIATHCACYAAKIDADLGEAGQWIACDRGWTAGGIAALQSGGDRLFAGTWSDGLFVGRFADGRLSWQRPGLESGLPESTRGKGRASIAALAASPARPGLLMAGGSGPLLLSVDGGERFASVADRTGSERITIPADWALCAAAHDIEVHDDFR